MRPHFPIAFRSVHAVSAKTGQLGNLREKLGTVHAELHPLQEQQFEEDRWMGTTRGERNRKLLI
jgi:hypothetical protein